LWARTYERDLKDALALQDEIAQDIAEQIRVQLTPKERSLLIQIHTVDPEAYDASLRGWYWLNQFTPEGTWKGLEYFQQATAKDPKYALAYAGIANSYLRLASYVGALPVKEAHPEAREAALKALELDPSLAEAHLSLGVVKLTLDWNWSGAEDEFKQAIALNPNYAIARYVFSNYLVAMGRLDEALKEIEHARDRDPFSPVINFWLGETLYHSRRYDDALRQERRNLEMFPDRPIFYEAIANVYEQKQMFSEAFAARQHVLSLNKDPSVTPLGEAYKRSGYRGYLLKAIQINEEAHEAHKLSPDIAHAYALLNDEAHTMTVLERGYREHFPGILFIRTAPEFDSIRSSPRFQDLVRRIGFPQSPSDKN
jgi:tetratricopeptide (TPR) repeat protein